MVPLLVRNLSLIAFTVHLTSNCEIAGATTCSEEIYGEVQHIFDCATLLETRGAIVV